MRSLVTTAVAVVALLGTACSGGEALVTTTVDRVDTFGSELFEERVVGSNPGCVTCHSLDEGVTIVGPSLYAVESRIPGMTDRDYVEESIRNPDAYVVEGFAAGQMNADWGIYLSDAQMESLIDFLLGE